MYFNSITQSIDSIPRYFIDNFLEQEPMINTVLDKRAILGKDNRIQSVSTMSMSLLKTVNAIGAYIYSQQYPVLKNMVIHETMICQPPELLTGDSSQHSRYLNRVGELFLVPIRGQCKILSADFDGASELKSGSIFRINNRVGNRFISSADFLSVGFTFLDFDLKNYLMPHDLNSPFVRRKDEYADPSLAPNYLNKLSEKNAY